MSVNAISLCRVSTHRQSNENNSLDKQRSSVDTAAERLEATIIKRWSVATSSKKGLNLGRTDLKDMLQYCKTKRNKVQYCIIDEIDRFMRSIEEYYWYKVELGKCGVKLVFASDPSLTDLSQEAVFKELIAIHTAESDNTFRSKKVTSHMQATVARGYWPFPVKAGYRRTLTKGLHEPDPERFPLIQSAIRKILARTHTIKEAQIWLKESGYRTVNGGVLDLDKLVTILKEPYYCGLLKASDWPVHSGLHQPMLSPEEFEELQIIISGRTPKKRNRHYNPEFPGQKLISCGKCDSVKRITGSLSSNGHGGKFARYYCMNCKKYWNREKVHLAVEEYLARTTLSKEARKELKIALTSVWRQKNSDRAALILSLNTKINHMNTVKSQLTLSYSGASDDMKKEIEGEIAKLRAKIDEHKNKIHSLEQDDKEIESFITFAFQYLDKLCSDWWGLDQEQRLWCQKIIFPGEIIVYPNYKIGTNKLSPIFTLENTKSSPKTAQNTSMVELPGTAPGSKR